MRNDSSGDDLIFLSGESEPEQTEQQDAGASPRLRRSVRKRKSTSGVEHSMLKGSTSKKKKTSPTSKMPKVTRSPPKGASQKPQEQPQAQGPQGNQNGSFEALLVAMEERLSAKIERASEASREAAQQAKLNSESLEQIESRVDANEAYVMEALRETETRIMTKVQERVQEVVTGQVKELVSEQLAAAGFDQDLTATNLSVRRSAIQQDTGTSYAGIAALPATTVSQSVGLSKEEKREAKFLHARRSLRLWPIPGGKKENLEDFLRQKLRMDESFIKEELGGVVLTRTKEPKNKNKDEFIVTFESKHTRRGQSGGPEPGQPQGHGWYEAPYTRPPSKGVSRPYEPLIRPKKEAPGP